MGRFKAKLPLGLAGILVGCSTLTSVPGDAAAPAGAQLPAESILARRSTEKTNNSDAISQRAWCRRKGLLVFHTDEALVPQDTNGTTDVYARDLFGGGIRLVSSAADGTAANGPSQNAAVSPEGTHIVFESRASNLVAGDTNGCSDIFVAGRGGASDWGTFDYPIVRVSLTSAGGQLSRHSHDPCISSDGDVAWTSTGDFARTGTSGSYRNIYLRKCVAGTYGAPLLVSGSGSGGQGHSDFPAITANGRYVVYQSDAPNLVYEDSNRTTDIFRYDADASRPSSILVSLSSSGVQGNGPSTRPSVSDSGTRIAFESLATNLVSGDSNGVRDIFLRTYGSFVPASTQLLSSGTNSAANGASSFPSLSRDGSRVAFASLASNLVASSDSNGVDDVFERDLSSGSVRRVSQRVDGSLATMGTPPNYPAASGTLPSYGEDGAELVFCSTCTDLDWANPTQNKAEVYLAQEASGTCSVVGKRAQVLLGNPCQSSSGVQANGDSLAGALSADGRWVAFVTGASNLGITDQNNKEDVYLRDRASAAGPICVSADGGVPQGGLHPSISSDGRYVVFQSSSASLVANDYNNAADVFLYDRLNGSVQLVSRSLAGGTGNLESTRPRISRDGRSVVFQSKATNLVSGDTNGKADVFVFDRVSGNLARASLNGAGTESETDCLERTFPGTGATSLSPRWAAVG